MTATINLFEQLLVRAIRHQRHGQSRSAAQLFRRLCGFPDVSPALAVQAHERLGILLLRRRRFRQARRQFQLALKLTPNSARLHLLLGLAHHHDDNGCLKQASLHYQQSLGIDARQPLCLAESGLLVLQAGDPELGLRLLRNAFDLSSNDPRILRRLIRGLLMAGFLEEAVKAARQSLFLAPRNRRLREIYEELRLDLIRRKQQMAEAEAERPEPVLLPFLQLADESVDREQIVREDEVESLPGPHLLRVRGGRRRRRAP